jgi:hypothetical protein
LGGSARQCIRLFKKSDPNPQSWTSHLISKLHIKYIPTFRSGVLITGPLCRVGRHGRMVGPFLRTNVSVHPSPGAAPRRGPRPPYLSNKRIEIYIFKEIKLLTPPEMDSNHVPQRRCGRLYLDTEMLLLLLEMQQFRKHHMRPMGLVKLTYVSRLSLACFTLTEKCNSSSFNKLVS